MPQSLTPRSRLMADITNPPKNPIRLIISATAPACSEKPFGGFRRRELGRNFVAAERADATVSTPATPRGFSAWRAWHVHPGSLGFRHGALTHARTRECAIVRASGSRRQF